MNFRLCRSQIPTSICLLFLAEDLAIKNTAPFSSQMCLSSACDINLKNALLSRERAKITARFTATSFQAKFDSCSDDIIRLVYPVLSEDRLEPVGIKYNLQELGGPQTSRMLMRALRCLNRKWISIKYNKKIAVILGRNQITSLQASPDGAPEGTRVAGRLLCTSKFWLATKTFNKILSYVITLELGTWFTGIIQSCDFQKLSLEGGSLGMISLFAQLGYSQPSWVRFLLS